MTTKKEEFKQCVVCELSESLIEDYEICYECLEILIEQEKKAKRKNKMEMIKNG